MIFITPSELQVLEQVKKGKAALEIAKVLYKDYSTVSYKIRSMIAKGVLKKGKKNDACEYTGVEYEVGIMPSGPAMTGDKVLLTPNQADVYEHLLAGKTGPELRKELFISGSALSAYYSALVTRGLLIKISDGKYEVLQKPYEIEKKPTTSHNKGIQAKYTGDVPQDILDYVKGHYKLYERKRGELARKLGITRTLLNQIAIEHKLAKGG